MKKKLQRMKKILYIIFIITFVTSCINKSKPVATVDVEFEIINNDIFTHFPGGLYFMDKHIAWLDPFSNDYFIHVLDAKSGVELGVMGKQGQGPKEFVSPMTNDITFNNQIFAVDVNGKNSGYLSIDSFLAGNEPFIFPSGEDFSIRNAGYSTRLDNDLYIGNNEDESDKTYPYISYSSGVKSSFGNYPIKEKQYRPGTSYAYNPDSKTLVIACIFMKHISAYKLKGNNFELLWEIRTNHDYYEREGEIVLDRKRMGARGLCLTKDYIVTMERDYETDDTDESTVGRDVDKLAKTLFVYDYNGNLLKILKCKVSFGRIAGNKNTNDVYAIVPNPDFMLVKISI